MRGMCVKYVSHLNQKTCRRIFIAALFITIQTANSTTIINSRGNCHTLKLWKAMDSVPPAAAEVRTSTQPPARAPRCPKLPPHNSRWTTDTDHTYPYLSQTWTRYPHVMTSTPIPASLSSKLNPQTEPDTAINLNATYIR